MVHRVKGEFGVDGPKVCPKVYRIYYQNWRKEFYTIHLTLRGNTISHKKWCFGRNKPSFMTFNENNIKEQRNFWRSAQTIVVYSIKVQSLSYFNKIFYFLILV